LARQAREEDNAEDAKKFYDMVRTDDPENVEAKFFYAYFNLSDAVNKDVPNKFVDYAKTAVSCVKMLKESALSDKEKMDLLEVMANTHTEEAESTYRYVFGKRDRSNSEHVDPNGIYSMSEVNGVQRTAIHSLEDMGNSIADLFGSDPKAMSLAAKLWEGIFSVQIFSQWYFFQSGSTKEESTKKWHDLVGKIQKVDSSFATPQQPKMVTCGSK
jgi:hypothetical protein